MKLSSNFIYMFVLLIFVCSVLSCKKTKDQNTITGYVRQVIDSTGASRPFENAQVYLHVDNPGYKGYPTTGTGPDGRYSFTEVKDGELYISASGASPNGITIQHGTTSKFSVNDKQTIEMNILCQ